MANEEYLDISGLTHFKTKMDEANESKFVKTSSLDSLINNKLTNIYTYKGTVPTIDQLPQSGNTVGDVYDVGDGMNYAWNGTKWDALGGNVITIDAALSDDSTNPVQNKIIKEALDKKASLEVATTSNNGLMSASDKEKLESIKDYTVFNLMNDGLVPHPTAGSDIETKYLRADGNWETPPDTVIVYNAISNDEIDGLFD